MTSARRTMRAAASRTRVARAVAARVRSTAGTAVGEDVPVALHDAGTGPLGQWAGLLPRRKDLRVVLLAAAGQRDAVTTWSAQFPEAAVHVLSPEPATEWSSPHLPVEHHTATTTSQIAERLRFIGPVDVLVDLNPTSVAEIRKRWRRLFYHVARKGAYVVAREVADPSFRHDVAEWFTDVVTADDPDRAHRADRNLADATDGLAVTRDTAIIRKRHNHYLKLRTADLADTLTSREPHQQVTEVQRREGGMLRVPGEVVSHTADVPIPWLPREMEYPPAVLRHFEGEINFAGQMLLFTRTAILPDSFKWWLTPNPKNPRARSVSPSFARIPHANIPARTLSGTYFQLDSTGPGHFGHIMTEGISKLWAWDEAKRQIPDLKALYFRRRVKSPADSIEHRLFRQYGICDEDIVAVGEPVRVTSLLSATPMWHNAEPHSVNPEFRAVWDRLAGIAATNVPTYDRIFVSRTDKWWRRSCRNTADVEDLFRAHGFEIVYPEMLDLSVQAAIFRDARVVAGFGGSAMFNVMYARRLETMILLNHEAYTARNEHLYSALLGCDIHYFWSAPDIPHPTHGWSQDAFDSGWEFDFGRNRDDLNQLLKGIS